MDPRSLSFSRKINSLSRAILSSGEKDQDPWKKDGENDELIIISNGPFLRKYLFFLEDLLKRFPSLHEEFNRSINIILLESAAEYMDYRNNSPSISQSQDTSQVDVWTTESSASK